MDLFRSHKIVDRFNENRSVESCQNCHQVKGKDSVETIEITTNEPENIFVPIQMSPTEETKIFDDRRNRF